MTTFICYTRFSVFHPDSIEWNSSKNITNKKDFRADYISRLYSESRLAVRAKIFFGLSLPSIAKGIGSNNFVHIIQYSDILPKKYRDMLLEAEKNYPFIKLDLVREDARYDGYSKIISETIERSGEECFGLFNLDDDDLISTDYFERVSKHVHPKNIGFIVSHGLGLSALYDDKTGLLKNLRQVYSPKINIGLLKICGYDEKNKKFSYPVQGSHTEIDRYNTTIIDSRENAFFWIRSVGQDTTHNYLDRDDELLKITQDLDRYPPYKTTSEDKIRFPTCMKILEKNPYDAKVLLGTNTSIQLENDFLKFDVDSVSGKIVIDYKLICESTTKANGALISIDFGDTSPDQIHGLMLSKNSTIGWYRYLQTTLGVVHASITFYVPDGFFVRGIKFRKWNTVESLLLTEVNISSSEINN
jgi:hypothetical protein